MHSYWIALLSILITGYTSIKAILKRSFGHIDRPWVDATIQQWIHQLLRLARVHCVVVNPNQVTPPSGKAVIVMCNHTSIYDIPLSYTVFPQHSMRMLAKKELSRMPLLGKGMKATEFLFIDRKNRKQALKDLLEVKALMESGIIMWIAPEGTRSPDGKLAAFKKGAFLIAIDSKATIIPIGIRGAYNILPTRTLAFNLDQTAEIHVGDPIDASDYTTDTKDLLIDKVHKAMEKLISYEELP